jgi:SAM-dependent methyltransferase
MMPIVNSPARTSALKVEEAAREIPGRSTIDFYQRNAVVYAQSTYDLSLQTEIERFVMNVAPPGQVLDVGCGGGRDLLALRQAGLCPTGLELSARLAKIASHHSGCPVVVGDLRHPPFVDASFQGLWAAASLLHLDRHEMLPVLRRLRQLLEPGAAFFASMKMGTGCEVAPDGRLFTYFIPEEWSALLRATGFADIRIATEVVDGRAGSRASAWLQSLSRAD